MIYMRGRIMKFYKKLVLTGAAALAVLGLSACSNNNSSSSSSNKKIPTKINKKTTVTFWYSLTGNAQSSLQKLTKDFEKKNPNITIKLQSQGGNYSDLQSKFRFAIAKGFTDNYSSLSWLALQCCQEQYAC